MATDGTRRPVRVRVDHAVRELSVQGQTLTPIVHSGTVPGTRMSSYGITMPPGHLSRAHVHLESDVLIHVLHGWAATLWGETMSPIRHGPGEQVLIPAGVAHAALNLSRRSSVIALEVRTDPDANRDVQLLPDLDPMAQEQVTALQDEHRDRIVGAMAEGRL